MTMFPVRTKILAVALCLLAVATHSGAASAAGHQPRWLRALEIRSDALNRKYHLGRYAHVAPRPAAAGFDWGAAAVGSATTTAGLASLAAVVLVVRGRGRALRTPRP